MRYKAQILLYIDEFSAESKDEAIAKVNAYIDSLADTPDHSLNWNDCDYAVESDAVPSDGYTLVEA